MNRALWASRFGCLALALLLWGERIASAGNTDEIMADNAKAVVYIEIDDEQGHFMDSGTGFIVSHDGYVVTAGHLNPGAGQVIWAMVGQRAGGARIPLDRRDIDQSADTGLWQLAQSPTCYHSVKLSDNQPEADARMLVLGFPETDGLSRAPVEMSNLSGSSDGFYRANGFLRSGNSGGPVFNEEGMVIALVHSGAPSGGNNTLVPISFALAMLNKRHVSIGLNASVPFPLACYQRCRVEANGVEHWTSETSWLVKRGEYPGGHNQPQECRDAIAAEIAGHPGARVDLDPGQNQPGISGMWEDSHKDLARQMHYTYFCKGTLRTGPVYAFKRSEQCQLWD